MSMRTASPSRLALVAIAFAAAALGGCGGTDDEAAAELPASCQDMDAIAPEACTLDGPIIIESLADFEQLCASPCTHVNGSIQIRNAPGLKDLTPLSRLTSVSGTLSIAAAKDALVSLHGLERLELLGALAISDSKQLRSLDGVEQLTTLEGALELQRLPALENIDALESVTSFPTKPTQNTLKLLFVPKLQSLRGLRNASFGETDALTIQGIGIVDMQGLEAITSVGGYFNIVENQALSSLNGLQNVTSVKFTLDISHNPMLSTCEAEAFANSLTTSYEPQIDDNGPCPN